MVIADIGGTSARWVLLRTDGTAAIERRTAGLNLATADGGEALAQVQMFLREDVELAAATEVHAYAAGAGSAERAARLQTLLQRCWPAARVHIETDLTGAARSLFGTAAGTALILGTGMNAGRCGGGHVTHGITSLGYILGDEGSGADLGRHLLTAALRGEVPPDLLAALFPEGIGMDQVVMHLYRGSAPQAWLAAMARPLAGHRAHPFVQGLLGARFGALARVLLNELPDMRAGEVRATGSIARAFHVELERVFSREGLRLTDVQAEAMPGLLRYHRQAGR